MPFKKGKSGNEEGRPTGSKNKKTIQWEALGDFITKEGAEKVMEYLQSLEGDEFFNKYKEILNYVKPKMQATQIDANIDAKVETITGVVIQKDEDK